MNLCSECEEHPSTVRCKECDDFFCMICNNLIHDGIGAVHHLVDLYKHSDMDCTNSSSQTNHNSTLNSFHNTIINTQTSSISIEKIRERIVNNSITTEEIRDSIQQLITEHYQCIQRFDNYFKSRNIINLPEKETKDTTEVIRKKKKHWCKEDICPYGDDCIHAHNDDEAFCTACNKHGHTLNDHPQPYCIYCRETGHSLRRCSRKKSILCTNKECLFNPKSECFNAHNREELVCSFCEIRMHGIDECANPNIRCDNCQISGHHQTNLNVCEKRIPMKIIHDDLCSIWVPYSSSSQNYLNSSSNDLDIYLLACIPNDNEHIHLSPNKKKKVKKCTNSIDSNTHCGDPLCKKAHNFEESFCVSCMINGHTFDDHPQPWCVFCQEKGHYLLECKKKCDSWCHNITDRNKQPGRFAISRDEIACIFCGIRGHGLDECANPLLPCIGTPDSCGLLGHSFLNKDVCNKLRQMKILSDDISNIWVPIEG